MTWSDDFSDTMLTSVDPNGVGKDSVVDISKLRGDSV